jgi:hypothetical protein
MQFLQTAVFHGRQEKSTPKENAHDLIRGHLQKVFITLAYGADSITIFCPRNSVYQPIVSGLATTTLSSGKNRHWPDSSKARSASCNIICTA